MKRSGKSIFFAQVESLLADNKQRGESPKNLSQISRSTGIAHSILYKMVTGATRRPAMDNIEKIIDAFPSKTQKTKLLIAHFQDQAPGNLVELVNITPVERSKPARSGRARISKQLQQSLNEVADAASQDEEFRKKAVKAVASPPLSNVMEEVFQHVREELVSNEAFRNFIKSYIQDIPLRRNKQTS